MASIPDLKILEFFQSNVLWYQFFWLIFNPIRERAGSRVMQQLLLFLSPSIKQCYCVVFNSGTMMLMIDSAHNSNAMCYRQTVILPTNYRPNWCRGLCKKPNSTERSQFLLEFWELLLATPCWVACQSKSWKLSSIQGDQSSRKISYSFLEWRYFVHISCRDWLVLQHAKL